MDRDDLIDRARQYAARQGLGRLELLGVNPGNVSFDD